MQLPIAIRPKTDADDPIVYDSWARSMADEMEIKDLRARRDFVRTLKPTIASILARSSCLVATARRDSNMVLGWCCYEHRPDARDVLHFVFVKKTFRQSRVASQLIATANLPDCCYASHATHWGSPRVARLFESLIHDPSLVEIS